MNLHDIVSGAIGVVNPFIAGTYTVSSGYTTGEDGSRVSLYSSVDVSAQVQPMSYRDLQQVEGLNLNGTRRSIYVNGRFDGVVRPSQKGGDLITILVGINRGVWLTALVLEQWPDWVKVAATLQNDQISDDLDLVTEDGQSITTEDGQHIEVETGTQEDLTTEGDEDLVTESGDNITTEGS